MKMMFFGIAAFLCCGASCSLNTNLPIFNGTTIEIINESDYEIEVFVNGNPVKEEMKNCNTRNARLKKGDTATLSLRNWNNTSVTVSISVKGWYTHGEFAGAARKQIYLYTNSYSSYSDSWIVTNQTFSKKDCDW